MSNSKTIERECCECGKSFAAAIKEINRGNARFCSLSCATRQTNSRNTIPREITCRHCGKPVVTIRSTTLYCSVKCKNSYSAGKRKYSNKKIISRLPCELCGWVLASRDVHDIIPVKNNGNDSLTNLISLCPNCHRAVHGNLISQERLITAVNTRTISSSSEVPEELDANVVIKETELLH